MIIRKEQVDEGASIARFAADLLLKTRSDQSGRSGSDLRRACGDIQAHAESYIGNNQIGAKLRACFDQARVAGATFNQFNRIGWTIHEQAAVSLLAVLLKQGCVCFSLQQMSLVLITMTFTSREDVDNVRLMVGEAFDAAEEVAADEMALQVYRKLVALHAAVTFHLCATAKPLPQMLQYQFAAPRPTLVLSYRLYDSAIRADQIRDENKIIHPAFAPRLGRALSF